MPNIIRLNWGIFETCVEKIAKDIQQSGEVYDYIVGIPRGGLVPAVLLSHILNIKTLEVQEMFNFEHHHHRANILLIDDIADSGNTLAKYSSSIDKATIYCKLDLVGTKDQPKYFARVADKDDWIMFPYEREINDSISDANFKDYHCETRDNIQFSKS
jgi:uncharacterized protein